MNSFSGYSHAYIAFLLSLLKFNVYISAIYVMLKIGALFFKYIYSICNNRKVWASLRNRYALVNPASTDFGELICQQLANKKINLVLIGQNEDRLIDLKSKLIHKVDVFIHPMNIANCSDFSFLDKYDIDLIINSIGDIETVAEQFIEQPIDSIIDSHLKAPMNLIKTVMTTMVNKHKGYVVNVGFGHCTRPTPHKSLKFAIKSTFKSWSESMYYEMMQYNVNVEYIEIGRMSSPECKYRILPTLDEVAKSAVNTLGSSYFTVPSFIHMIFFIFKQALPRSCVGRVSNSLNHEIKKTSLSDIDKN